MGIKHYNSDFNSTLGKWYFEEAEAIIDHLGVWIDESNFLIGERQYGGLKWKMDHLVWITYSDSTQHTLSRRVTNSLKNLLLSFSFLFPILEIS